MTALEREFLLKLCTALARPSAPEAFSVDELNEGLCPRWQRDAAEGLVAAGLVVESVRGGRTRYAPTAAGWEAAGARPPAGRTPPVVPRSPYGRPARTGYVRPGAKSNPEMN